MPARMTPAARSRLLKRPEWRIANPPQVANLVANLPHKKHGICLPLELDIEPATLLQRKLNLAHWSAKLL
jgi:hypothetical protein